MYAYEPILFEYKGIEWDDNQAQYDRVNNIIITPYDDMPWVDEVSVIDRNGHL